MTDEGVSFSRNNKLLLKEIDSSYKEPSKGATVRKESNLINIKVNAIPYFVVFVLIVIYFIAFYKPQIFLKLPN
jgi:hypothetical protein